MHCPSVSHTSLTDAWVPEPTIGETSKTNETSFKQDTLCLVGFACVNQTRFSFTAHASEICLAWNSSAVPPIAKPFRHISDLNERKTRLSSISQIRERDKQYLYMRSSFQNKSLTWLAIDNPKPINAPALYTCTSLFRNRRVMKMKGNARMIKTEAWPIAYFKAENSHVQQTDILSISLF